MAKLFPLWLTDYIFSKKFGLTKLKGLLGSPSKKESKKKQ